MTDFTPLDPGRLNRYLDEFAVEQLTTYFESGKYTGGHFERFGGGGDHPDTAGRFTSTDIVAASFLGVSVPGPTAIELLEDRYGEIGDLLTAIPRDVDLWEAPEDLVGPDSAAQQLWHLLSELPGIDGPGAGILLARKRPRLIPVYDRVIRVSLARDDVTDWWLALRAVLSKRPALVNAISAARDETELGDEVSIIRVLHVCTWMREYGKPDQSPDPTKTEAPEAARQILPLSAERVRPGVDLSSAKPSVPPRGRSRGTRYVAPRPND